MSQSAEDRLPPPQILPSLYAPIQDDLAQVETVFQEELRSDHPFVDGLVKYGLRMGGKRLRPALVLLSARASGGLRREHILLAAAAEMIHTATLVHDDVLDEATIRRHVDTVNARWNNETSVLLGDYLLTQSLCLASSVDDVFACRAFGDASRKMCEGELLQVESRGNYALTEKQYFEIVAGKTGALTACCCQLGAHYAGADPEVVAALTRYGLQLGIAFQIADDLLDVLGDEAMAGKSLGTDLLKQKSTLPLIRLLGLVSPLEREQLLAQISVSNGGHRDVLRPWWDRSDAVAYTRDIACHFSSLASRELDIIEPSPARDSLRGIAQFVVNRES